jgi:predicted esterase
MPLLKLNSTVLNIAILFFLSSSLIGQQPNLTVPKEILDEMETVKVMVADSAYCMFKVVRPKLSNGEKDPVVLCLSGGDQTEAVVNYSYAAWFRSEQFDRYWKIMPVSVDGANFKDIDSAQAVSMMTTIQREFNTHEDDWIALGTSNGGLAAFRFVAASPKLFAGVIVVPGSMSKDIVPNSSWNHLKVLLAVGSEDIDAWKNAADKTVELLSSDVAVVQKRIVKKAGHVLPIGFKIDPVYKAWFKL